jgi:hypothetical protein
MSDGGKVRARHRRRRAVVYVRQSTPGASPDANRNRGAKHVGTTPLWHAAHGDVTGLSTLGSACVACGNDISGGSLANWVTNSVRYTYLCTGPNPAP